MRPRDLRDPERLGSILLNLVRVQKVPVLEAADELTAYAVPDYWSRVMSSDPEMHHSKTPQHINLQDQS